MNIILAKMNTKWRTFPAKKQQKNPENQKEETTFVKSPKKAGGIVCSTGNFEYIFYKMLPESLKIIDKITIYG